MLITVIVCRHLVTLLTIAAKSWSNSLFFNWADVPQSAQLCLTHVPPLSLLCSISIMESLSEACPMFFVQAQFLAQWEVSTGIFQGVPMADEHVVDRYKVHVRKHYFQICGFARKYHIVILTFQKSLCPYCQISKVLGFKSTNYKNTKLKTRHLCFHHISM